MNENIVKKYIIDKSKHKISIQVILEEDIDFEFSLDKLIQKLIELKTTQNTSKFHYHNLEILKNRNEYGNEQYELCGFRQETDEEFIIRQNRIKKEKENKEKNDLKEKNRIIKKYNLIDPFEKK